eukprot:CAMPEP_0171197654 /NCGR_PEP_ID=MMETSP0790-20130122/22522_1 /TAXON_ID=2925 /ORGANISM="Alexandrium catenella, Strain OF101" /LENGTH=383 /DNA_ID=CAMNT_0011662901 /DNA_START=76 /DNA_END=1224 /DNA_ORIENTATION=+
MQALATLPSRAGLVERGEALGVVVYGMRYLGVGHVGLVCERPPGMADRAVLVDRPVEVAVVVDVVAELVLQHLYSAEGGQVPGRARQVHGSVPQPASAGVVGADPHARRRPRGLQDAEAEGPHGLDLDGRGGLVVLEVPLGEVVVAPQVVVVVVLRVQVHHELLVAGPRGDLALVQQPQDLTIGNLVGVGEDDPILVIEAKPLHDVRDAILGHGACALTIHGLVLGGDAVVKHLLLQEPVLHALASRRHRRRALHALEVQGRGYEGGAIDHRGELAQSCLEDLALAVVGEGVDDPPGPVCARPTEVLAGDVVPAVVEVEAVARLARSPSLQYGEGLLRSPEPCERHRPHGLHEAQSQNSEQAKRRRHGAAALHPQSEGTVMGP